MQMHEINHFSKFYKISPRTQTLISIKSQCLYTNSVVMSVFIDQIKNWILEAYHQQLGPDMTFIIWWLSFYFENIGNELKFSNFPVLFKFYLFVGLRVVLNLKVYYLAKTQYPEFDGFKGCKFPGTLAPREIAFTARETGHFEQEKTNFLPPKSIDKGVNIIHFNSAIQIYLTPATPTPNLK